MAKDLKAQVEIDADVTGVQVGIKKVEKSLASMGATAAAEGKKAADGIESIGRGSENAARKTERDMKSLVNSIQRTTAAAEAGGRGTSKYFEVLINQRGLDPAAFKPYLDQLRAVETAQASANAALTKGGIQFDKYGISVKQNAAALRQVPAQLTDIIVGLQGGQAPLTVLLQQGGQLKDVFGGVVPAAKALGGAVLGLVSPYTLAASAVAALGFAYFQGSKEADAFNKAIVLSGNATGATVSNLTAMAQRIDAITGTQSGAASALAEFVKVGVVGTENLEKFTTTAIRMEKLTGQAVKETAKQFAELGKSPVEAAVKLNETTNFLTTSLYDQIRALDEQGRSAEAAAVAQKGYADALDQRLIKVESQLGAIERAWKGIVAVAKDGWDAMLNVGRPNTIEQQLANVSKEIAAAQGQDKNRAFRMPWDDSLDTLKQRQAGLQEMLRLQGRSASAEAESARQVKAQIDYRAMAASHADKSVKAEQEIAKARQLGLAAGRSEAEIEKLVASIREKYADKSAGKKGLLIDKAELNRDLSEIKAASEGLIGTYAGSERIIESLRSASLISDREYYESKRAFINLEGQAKEDALIQEIARRQKEKLSDDKKIDNIKKIEEAEAKLARVREDTQGQLIVLDVQEAAAKDRLTTSMLSLRQAAEDYYQSQNRQQDRMLAGIGQGNQRRGLDAGINQIEDRYDGQRREAANQKALAASIAGERGLTNEQKKEFADRLALIDEYQAKSIASYTDYYDKLIATQGDWALGAQEALRNYADESANVFSQVGSLVTNAFRGMEDALVNFVKTGKLDFKSLADSIIADLARIAAKKLIMGLVDMFMGAYGGGGASSGSNYSLSSGGGSWQGLKMDGGGYTGSGSRSGGMDGKGGFMAMLHPQETVIDHSKGQGMGGNVTVNVINQGGGLAVTGQTKRQNADGSMSIDVMVDALDAAMGDRISNGSGSMARAMEGRYGLRTAVS